MKKEQVFIIIALGCLTALVPFSIDLYLPAFRAIATDLQVKTDEVSFSLSALLAGVAIGQLCYGPLLDRFGRKKPLYAGLLLNIAATIGCFFAKSMDTLIIFRFFQGLGGCAATVAANAMVRDYFPLRDIAKVFSFLMLILGISPMIAPTIGGYVTTNFGWQHVFIVLLGLGILILILAVYALPDTFEPDRDRSLKPSAVAASFRDILREPQFITYAVFGALTLGGLFAFIAISPQLLMGVYRFNEHTFGWTFAGLSGWLIVAGQLNRLLEKKFKSSVIVLMAAVTQCLLAIIFVVATITNILGIGGTIFMIGCILTCTGISLPNAAALTFAPFKKNSGTAAALFGAMEMIAGALTSSVAGLFKMPAAVLLAIMLMALASLSFFVLKIGSRRISKGVFEA